MGEYQIPLKLVNSKVTPRIRNRKLFIFLKCLCIWPNLFTIYLTKLYGLFSFHFQMLSKGKELKTCILDIIHIVSYIPVELLQKNYS